MTLKNKPGEHGVSKSSTVSSELLLDGPRIYNRKNAKLYMVQKLRFHAGASILVLLEK